MYNPPVNGSLSWFHLERYGAMSLWCEACELCYRWECDSCSNGRLLEEATFCVDEQKVACSVECAKKLAASKPDATWKWSKLRSPYEQANMICDEHYHYVDNSKTCVAPKCINMGKVLFEKGCYSCGNYVHKGETRLLEIENEEEEEDEKGNTSLPSEEKEEGKIEVQEKKEKQKPKTKWVRIFICREKMCQDYIAFCYGIISASSDKYDKNRHGYEYLGRSADETGYCCGSYEHAH